MFISYLFLALQIEIRLKKEEAIRWSKLEGEDSIPQAVKPAGNQLNLSCIG